jgi:hypothetical protein
MGILSWVILGESKKEAAGSESEKVDVRMEAEFQRKKKKLYCCV